MLKTINELIDMIKQDKEVANRLHKAMEDYRKVTEKYKKNEIIDHKIEHELSCMHEFNSSKVT